MAQIDDNIVPPPPPTTPFDRQALKRRLNVTLLSLAVLAIVWLIWWLDSSGRHEAANFVIVAMIGIGTGATELMSRYRDRPFDALMSKPGLFYMALNGGAGALALHLLGERGPDDPAQRVLLAGFSAMAIFRSGLFTTRVGDKDVSFGPNLVLQVILDVLDRAYDRERAFRRAELILQLMGGVDFQQAKASLPEVCFNLLQNVRPEEREKFRREIEAIERIEGLSDEARAMALGLNLMGIVGEDTLRAAGNNLGSTIFSFQPLSDELVSAISKPSEQDVIGNLLQICNNISHDRAQQSEKEIGRILAEVDKLASLQAAPKAMLLAYRARKIYGEKVLVTALKMLPVKLEAQIPAAPPPPPPPPVPAPAPADPPGGAATDDEKGG
jgi:hypothetical protein